MLKFLSAVAVLTLTVLPLGAQFRDDFSSATLRHDPAALEGWAWHSGDGAAVIDFVPGPDGCATIRVDAARDRRNVWWAIIRRCVSADLDLSRMAEPGVELRVEARVRTSVAPRRVNLHFNTQRTTDFHSHLMEYDLAEAGVWHTISMTTREFDARPGDRVFAQLALMDWGTGEYRLDVDYVKVDLVDIASAGPDLGVAVPYHPPLKDPAVFPHALRPAAASTIDLAYPDLNFADWSDRAAASPPASRLLAVGGAQLAILRWDFSAFAGRRVDGSGLLEVTTHAVHRLAREVKDFGLLRVVEIIGGDPRWSAGTVTAESLLRGRPLDDTVLPQMIIDVEANAAPGGKTWITISEPVLQRLLDGRATGLALRPLGAINATFFAPPSDAGAESVAPVLRFNLRE